MSGDSTKTPEAARFVGPAQFTIANVAVLYHELDGLLADASAVEIDLGAVERIDVSGVQLLLAAARHAASVGSRISIHDGSGVLGQTIEVLGLEDEFAAEGLVTRASSGIEPSGEE